MGVWLAAAPAPAQAPSEAEREFSFASGLVSLGFPDFAERLLDRLTREHPGETARARMVQVEILISKRKFAEAEELVKNMPPNDPKTLATRLAVANGYFRMNEADRAKAIYQEFFAQYKGAAPTDPDLKRFYLDSAYRFSQMLERAGDLKGAVEYLNKALAAQPEESIARRLRSDLAGLAVRAARAAPAAERGPLLEQAAAACDQLLWRTDDIWFGQAVITLANIELLKGDAERAEKVIRDYLDILRTVDEALKAQQMSDLSPMAGARFLLGELAEKKAAAAAAGSEDAVKFSIQALTEYYNVFAKYSESDWGAEAGYRAQQIKDQLEKLGKTVKVDLGGYAGKAMDAQLKMADSLFAQKKNTEARDAYLKVLNRFPQAEAAPRALMNLLLSAAQAKDEWLLRAGAEYLAERFRGNNDAAAALLAGAKHYFDAGDEARYLPLYNLYLDYFPQHPNAPAVMFTVANLRRKAGDDDGANAYLERIIKQYPKDAYYLHALSAVAWSQYAVSNYPAAAGSLQRFVAAAPPRHDRALAQFSLADCLLRQNDFNRAAAEFRALQGWIGPTENNPYATTAAEQTKLAELREKTLFFMALSLSRATAADAAATERLRAAAIQLFDQFVAAYPKSELAPRAMNLKGSVYLQAGRMDEAVKVFDDLARAYPQSEDGRSSLYSLVRSAVEIKKYDVARDAFGRMKKAAQDGSAAGAQYSLDQFVRIGQWMLEAGAYEDAVGAFEFILATKTEDRALLERSLYGMGRAQYELKQYDRAVARLTEMLERYPQSGLFFEAKMMLGYSLREAGRYPEAMQALSDVFRYGKDPLLNIRAQLDLARIQLALADQADAAGKTDEARNQRQAAAASYQRVALLTNPKDAALRPFLQESILRSIELFRQLDRPADVVEAADQFLKIFPTHEKVPDVRRQRAEASLKAGTAPAGGN